MGVQYTLVFNSFKSTFTGDDQRNQPLLNTRKLLKQVKSKEL